MLTEPLISGQSAPILYVAVIKAISSIYIGPPEISLRSFSVFSFLWLLVCEWFFLKNILKMDNIKTWFVLALTAVVPNYVYNATVPAFKFKNGYESLKIGKSTRNNIIYGVRREEWRENGLGPELYSIIESRKAYLLFSHFHQRDINPGLSVLSQYGTVILVKEHYATPLFYFKVNELSSEKKLMED